MFTWVTEQRERVILGDARRYLEGDEEVIEWVRARQFRGRREGFMFVTGRQLIVHFTGRGDGSQAFEWSEVKSWAVNDSVDGGPIVGIESDDAAMAVQMPVHTDASADHVRRFLHHIEELAPAPGSNLTRTEAVHPGPWRNSDVRVVVHRRSMPAKVKRILVTVLGLVMVLGGLLLTPVPGPWSFPVVIAGLAILASEYDWAKDALQWSKKKAKQARSKLSRRGGDATEPVSEMDEDSPAA